MNRVRMQCGTVVLFAVMALAGCQSHSRQSIPTGAPKPAVSMALLNEVDPPDSARQGAMPGTLDLPCDYELVWQATGPGRGHWLMRRLTNPGGSSGRVRVRYGEAGRADAENLQPAYIEQEMARLLVSMQEVNAAQAEQLVQAMAEVRRLRESAESAARDTVMLSGKLAEKELQLRALQERAAAAAAAAAQPVGK